jgi:hypothetical protein
MAKSSEVLPGPDSDARVREVKGWLKSKGVRDFEPVSLFCDQLTKVCLTGSIHLDMEADVIFRTPLPRLKSSRIVSLPINHQRQSRRLS